MMVRPRYDPQLVRRAQQGDPEALERLLEQAGPMLLRTCIRHARPGVEAEDAFQEALVDIIKGLQTLDNPAAFASWSRQIAYRRAIKPRFVTWLLRKVWDREPDEYEGGWDPEREASRRERVALLQRGLQGLGEKERIVVVGTHVQGHTCREVAEREDWNEATTRRRKQRGEARLRKLLEPVLAEDDAGSAQEDEEEDTGPAGEQSEVRS